MKKVISKRVGIPLQLSVLLMLIFFQRSSEADTPRCGERRLPPLALITAGAKVEPGEWPWHIALFDREHGNKKIQQYICGGTIISKHFVLTAAHCFEKHQYPDRYFLKAGVHQLNSDAGTEIYNLSEIIIHQHYEHRTKKFFNDIALMRPDRLISFEQFTALPICLWPGIDSTFIDILKQTGVVVGFGLDENQTISELLQKASIQVVDKQQCIEQHSQQYQNLHEDDGKLCGNVTQTGTNVCTGDSGGGLYFGKNKIWYLRGIVSAGARLELDTGETICHPNIPATYTDVTKYINWISEHQRILNERNLLDVDHCGMDRNAEMLDEMQKPVFNQYPWNVLLEIRQIVTMKIYLVCNGVLVHPRFVLTVGHCVEGVFANYKLHSVRLGEYEIGSDEDLDPNPPGTTIRYQSVDIEKVFFQNNNNRPIYTSNLALLKLKYNADTNKPNIKPICLPSVDEYKGSSLTHTGWKRNKVKFPKLERDAMNVSSTATCNREYEKLGLSLSSSKNFTCAEYRVRPTGHCHEYATGSTLQYIKRVNKIPRYFLAGLMVFNFPHCHTKGSEMFLNVASAAQWIREVIVSSQLSDA